MSVFSRTSVCRARVHVAVTATWSAATPSRGTLGLIVSPKMFLSATTVRYRRRATRTPVRLMTINDNNNNNHHHHHHHHNHRHCDDVDVAGWRGTPSRQSAREKNRKTRRGRTRRHPRRLVAFSIRPASAGPRPGPPFVLADRPQ